MGVPRSIETRNKIHACMALRWNETKKDTVLRIRMGSDQGRGRCVVALACRSNLTLISRSVSLARRLCLWCVKDDANRALDRRGLGVDPGRDQDGVDQPGQGLDLG